MEHNLFHFIPSTIQLYSLSDIQKPKQVTETTITQNHNYREH